jgi:uncharacterized SAM-binding protein YcdF (DUF218 family)
VSWIALAAVFAIMAGIPAVILSPRHHRWRWGAGVAVAVVVLLSCAATDGVSRRVLQFTLMPLGLAWAVVGSLAVTSFMLSRPVQGSVLAGGFLLLTLGSNQWLGAALISTLERRIEAQPATDERYDVVCVLGGGSNRRFDGVAQFGITSDRLRVGALQQREGRTPLLLTTGVFAPDTALLWHQLGIPVEAILVESDPGDTAQEIALIKRLVQERGWKRIGVVSSAWHLPRVLRLAARQDLALAPLPSDWLGAVPPWTGEQVVPRSEGTRLIEVALKEHLGLWLGR